MVIQNSKGRERERERKREREIHVVQLEKRRSVAYKKS
jgi:hypothetical protein